MHALIIAHVSRKLPSTGRGAADVHSWKTVSIITPKILKKSPVIVLAEMGSDRNIKAAAATMSGRHADMMPACDEVVNLKALDSNRKYRQGWQITMARRVFQSDFSYGWGRVLMKTGRITMQARKSLQNITEDGLKSFRTMRMAENELAHRKTAPSMERTGRQFLIFSITRFQ